MTKTKSTIIFLVVAIIIIAVIVLLTNTSSAPTLSETVATNTASTTAVANSKTYTLIQIATHNSAQSCWTTINGGVYDVTAWINKHPGGAEAILSLCGKDGSAAFNDQHGGERRPANELATFKIGTLIK